MSEFQLVPVKQKKPKPKRELSWRRFLVLMAGLIVFGIVGYFGVFELTATSKYCIKCHEMRPEYVTWKASSHSQFECVACHKEPGVLGDLKAAAKSAGILATHMTQPSDSPIKMKFKVDDEVCSNCHSQNRSVTPPGDLLVPHDRHAKRGVACVQCHKGIAHGNIVDRQARLKIDLVDWTEHTGANQMTAKNVNPPMDACLNCHSIRNVTTKCSICHSQVVIPATHKTKAWLADGQHGFEARKGIRECHKCHSYTFSGDYKPFGMDVNQYIKQNEFCTDCHSTKRPPSHGTAEKNWMPIHFTRAYSKGLNSCLTCHFLNKPKVESPNTIKVYCNSCHWFTPNKTQ